MAGEAALLKEVEILKAIDPAFCSMTYGAGGSTHEKTLDLVHRIQRGRPRDDVPSDRRRPPRAQVRSVLDRLETLGIGNIIALAGDPPDGAGPTWTAHPDGFATPASWSRRRSAGGFSVAVAGFPEVHPRAAGRAGDLGYQRDKSTPAPTS